MKRCPQCSRDYTNDSLSFCLDDGSTLLDGPASMDEPATAVLPSFDSTNEGATRLFDADSSARAAEAPGSHERSIAILPFTNISADPENDYFCDGLAEELLNALSKIKGLKVAARTSSFSFRGSDVKVGEIGKSLDVRSVLEGSVRKSGGQLRVQLQLVNASDGFQIWTCRYDRELKDIFAVQDEIAISVVNALKVELLGEEKSRVLRRNTDNTEAYQLFLRGRHQFLKLTPQGFMKSIELFEAALEVEPDYAPAYAGLGLTYGTLVVFGGLAPEVGNPKMALALERALEIDENLPEAQFALAMAQMQNERDWIAAEDAFTRAIALNPGYVNAHAQYGVLLASLDRPDEALVQAKKALDFDPLGLVTLLDTGIVYWILKDFDRVRDQGLRLIELNDTFSGGHFLLAVAEWAIGDIENATNRIEKAAGLGLAYGMTLPGCLYGIAGKRKKAEEILDDLLSPSPGQCVFSSQLAIVYAGLGNLDAAFEYLEIAIEKMEPIPFKSLIRQLPGVAKDPRYREILKRVGLPV